MQKDQQKLMELIKGKKVAFIGAGVSHKTLIKEFVELGAHVTLCDQKKSVEDFGDYAATIKELGIDLSLGENYLDGFKGQDIIMRTPGFVGYFEKPLQDAMAAGTMVTSEVELFFDFCPCEILMQFGIQYTMFNLTHGKHFAQHFRDFNRSGTHQYGASCCHHFFYLFDDCFIFFTFCLVNAVIHVITGNGAVSRNNHYIQFVDVPQLAGFCFCRTGHTG